MSEKSLSELCEAAHEEVMNNEQPVYTPESDNAYAHEEDFELDGEQKSSIENILGRDL